MTDRELLELAAKAAGLEVYEGSDGTVQNRPVWVFSAGGGMGTMPFEEQWSPLREDVQAFRLAVKLGICVDQTNYSVEEFRSAWAMTYIDAYEERYMDNNGDIYAATRRAIVRAAAAIGEQMK